MKTKPPSTFNRFKSKSSAQSVASLLGPTFKSLGLEKKIKQYEVLLHWTEIVGGKIAAVSKPEKIVRGKILVVKVSDGIWAQELALRKAEILEKFRLVPNGPTFEDIRFIVSGPTDFQRRRAVND
ncbi:MAG: DUF721 domain-containing protein [Deltaproteobacteria bacterium]|nr:DUF721 domain-containing protein [Deltaproteobacteria bacterium]